MINKSITARFKYNAIILASPTVYFEDIGISALRDTWARVVVRAVYGFLIAAVAIIVNVSSARADVSYEFCLTVVSAVKSDTFGVRYKFPGIDFGKEAARVVASQKFKEPGTMSVSVTDYSSARCGLIREETSFTATADQVTDLGKAIARGDPAGIVVAVTALSTGTTVKLITGVGGAVAEGAHWVGCRLGIGC